MGLDLDRIVTVADSYNAVGAVLAGLVVLLVLMRAKRRHGLFLVGRAVTMPLVLAWEAQGLHELAIATGLDGAAAWAVALLTGAILATLAAGADEHHRRYGNLGWPGRLVWIVAVPMGLIVALTSANPAVFALRIVLPLLVALLWWVKYAPILTFNEPTTTSRARTGAWRWTPRRIGVALGLLDPTDADLSQVHAERQIRRLTTTAHKLHHGARWLRGLRAARLRRLGLVATPAMVAEVHRRVSLVHSIERLTDPLTPQPGADIEGGHVPRSGRTPALAPPVNGQALTGHPQPDTGHEGPDTGHGWGPDSAPDMSGSRLILPPDNGDRPRPGKRTPAAPDNRPSRTAHADDRSNADLVAKAVAVNPRPTQAEVARLLELSERTVRRHWPRPDKAGQANGQR